MLTAITTTITETATINLYSVVPRAANIMAAVAEDIINSVVTSGTIADATPTQNPQRDAAVSGLANACSCNMVQPTATVTSSFALPPAVSTECIYQASTDLRYSIQQWATESSSS
jgi:hypothetical protein